MADHEGRVLRRAITARERGRGKRYPEALRARATTWVRAQVGAGIAIRAAAAAIGIDGETARRWLESAPPEIPRRRPARRQRDLKRMLLPVEVVADEPEHARRVAVISAAGYRVEGLTLVEAAALLRAVG